MNDCWNWAEWKPEVGPFGLAQPWRWGTNNLSASVGEGGVIRHTNGSHVAGHDRHRAVVIAYSTTRAVRGREVAFVVLSDADTREPIFLAPEEWAREMNIPDAPWGIRPEVVTAGLTFEAHLTAGHIPTYREYGPSTNNWYEYGWITGPAQFEWTGRGSRFKEEMSLLLERALQYARSRGFSASEGLAETAAAVGLTVTQARAFNSLVALRGREWPGTAIHHAPGEDPTPWKSPNRVAVGLAQFPGD